MQKEYQLRKRKPCLWINYTSCFLFLFKVKAWDPCQLLEGSFFRHPTDCNQYFQCEHKKSILQTCTGALVFDVESNNCVHDRPGIVCPDPAKAPPKPPGYEPITRKIPSTKPTTTPATTTTDSVFSSNQTRPEYPGRPSKDLWLIYCYKFSIFYCQSYQTRLVNSLLYSVSQSGDFTFPIVIDWFIANTYLFPFF